MQILVHCRMMLIATGCCVFCAWRGGLHLCFGGSILVLCMHFKSMLMNSNMTVGDGHIPRSASNGLVFKFDSMHFRFNEPGYESRANTPAGREEARKYNESLRCAVEMRFLFVCTVAF